MYPFVVCLVFYFPMLILIKELIKDDKSKRLMKMYQLGLGKDTVIVTWLITHSIIILFYTAMINAIGHTYTIGASNFFITYLYGMTTFGSAFIIV